MTSLSVPSAAAWRSAAMICAGVMMVLAVVVMAAAGHHASALGADPGWVLFPEEERVDIWADAREHYRRVVRFGLVAWAGAWTAIAVVLFAGPAAPHPPPGPSSGRGGHATVPWLLGPLLVLAVVVSGALLGSSIPALVAGCTAGVSLSALASWLWMRSETPRRGLAWVLAGLGVLIGTVGGVLLGAALLGAWIILGAPGIGVLGAGVLLLIAMTPALGIGALLARGILRAFVADPEASAAPAAPGACRTGLLLAAPVVLALVLASVALSRPVPAPPADAEAPLARTWVDLPVSGPDPAEEESVDPRQADPVPVPADVPVCTADQLRLRAGDWDLGGARSTATLEARNISTRTCALRGRPELQLRQGGGDIDLRIVPSAGQEGEDPDGLGAVLPAGGVAVSPLEWSGGGEAADRETGQRLAVRLPQSGGSIVPVPVVILAYPLVEESFAGMPGAQAGTGVDAGWGDPPPAPVDVRDGEPGGAELGAGIWALIS
ncbi:DUF4232 domain-containing protein [Brachybacterium hainanense]|uniref:DUF4232 domain-containing protein n=1 Tax=Brachybacterium hainanense TaxID=1541174 RepID=A0ABV6R650_9MICO